MAPSTSISTEDRTVLTGMVLFELQQKNAVPHWDSEYRTLLRSVVDYLTGSSMITAKRFESIETAELDMTEQSWVRDMMHATVEIANELDYSAHINQDNLRSLQQLLIELQERATEFDNTYRITQ